MSQSRCLHPTKRRKYSLLIDESRNGAWMQFTVIPKSYNKRTAFNFTLFAILEFLFLSIASNSSLLNLKLRVIAFGVTSLSTLVFLRKPPIESFAVFRNYGVQLTVVKGLLLLPDKWNRRLMARSQFIPRDEIVDIIINEGFFPGFQVIFYMAVIVKESKKLKLLFSVCLF